MIDRKSVIGFLDIGTSKVVCLIGAITNDGVPVCLSIGEAINEGFSNGKSTHREHYAGAVLRDHPSGTGCGDPVF